MREPLFTPNFLPLNLPLGFPSLRGPRNPVTWLSLESC